MPQKCSFQLEFRSFPKNIWSRVKGKLHEEMVGVAGEISKIFSETTQNGFVCNPKAGIGSIRFSGEVDTTKIAEILHHHFQKTRLVSTISNGKKRCSMPEILEVKDNIIIGNKGLCIPRDIPKFVIIDAPENS